MRAKLTSFLMILCLLMFFAAVAGAAPAGKVTNLEGRADLTAPGKPAKALFIGDAVNVGDILRTKSGSKLEVTWVDGSIARLSENSRLKVTEFSLGTKKRSTILSLFRGKVQNIVTGTTKLFGAKDGSKYEVHTPTSVCGVRGTIFFSYHENGVSGVLFTEGQGFMYSKGQPGNVKPVAPGILMIVTSANKPPMAQPAKPGDANKLFNATNPSEKKKDDKKGEDKKEGGTGGGTSGSGGGSAAAAGSTSGAGTDESGTGGTTGETMLGGDPTATLGTAPPGTLASQIETGTTADTPGISSAPGSNPINQQVQVNQPIYQQGQTQAETFTTFTQNVTLGDLTGTLTGKISNAGDTINTGTLALSGNGQTTTAVSTINAGSMSDSSTYTYDGYLAGMPGSWSGLFTGLTNKGGSSSLLKGSLSDANYSGSSLSATGSITRGAVFTISGSLFDIYNGTISVPSYFNPRYSGSTNYDGQGYNTSAGGLIAVWSLARTGGVSPFPGIAETLPFHYYEYCSYTPYAYLYKDNLVRTDDGNGHFEVSGDISFMNDRYYGLMSMNTKAVQTSYAGDGLYYYDEIGVGSYVLDPLKYYGSWGTGEQNPSSLYYNNSGSMTWAGHEEALIGGLTKAPWDGSTDFKAIGQYGFTAGLGSYTYYLWNSSDLVGYAPSYTDKSYGGYFEGLTAGIWGSSKKGSIRAIYVTPVSGGSSKAGILVSDDIATTLYTDDGMWTAAGNLGPYSGPTYMGDPTYWYLDDGTPQSMKLSGSFTGITGSSANGSGYFKTHYLNDNGQTSPPWGIYNLKLTGTNTYSGKPSTGDSDWTADLGGRGQFGYDSNGYWLASISNGAWTENGQITGSMSGSYLTPTYKGNIVASPFYGVNISSGGSWIGESIGIYEGTPLAFSGSVDWGSSGSFDFNSHTMVYDVPWGTYQEYVQGIIGIDDTATLSGIGTYAVNTNPMFAMDISKNLSSDFPNTDSMRIWFGSTKNSTQFAGKMMGLYANWNSVNKNYDVGYLTSNSALDKLELVTGDLYSNIGMWEITSGELTSSSKGTIDTTGDITVTTTPRTSTVIGTEGISGVYNRYDMYFTQTADAWGVWRAETGGTYSSDPTSNWYGSSGAVAGNDYSLYQITGTNWADGQMAGTINGRWLSSEGWGRYSGDIVGVYNASPKTWQALAVGKQERAVGTEALTFSSALTGNLYQVVTGTLYNKEYQKPNAASQNNWFDPLRYETNYFVPDAGTYDVTRTIAFESNRKYGGNFIYKDEYHYLPSGKWVLIRKGLGVTHAAGSGDTNQALDLSDPTKSPNFDGTIVADPTTPFTSDNNYVRSFSSAWENINALVQNGAFTGILGGLNNLSLWNSSSTAKTELVLMGNHDAYNGSQIFGTSMYYGSSVNGAFVGILAGIIQDTNATAAYSENPLDGLIIGLYVDPSGNAGVLKGNFTGTSYTGINMWESTDAAGAATLYRYYTSPTTYASAPSTLLGNFFKGAIGPGINSAIYGTFGGNGSIYSPLGVMGSTLSIASQPDWGIFTMQIGMANTYANPTSATSWTSTLFGSGVFGKYTAAYSPYSYTDLGFWYAGLTSGTWVDGKLTGTLGGEFLTHKKIGTLEGSLLGTYDGITSGTWQATSAGAYVKTRNVLFSSEIWGDSHSLATAKTGSKNNYGDGSSYNYWYNNDGASSNNYGNSTYYNATAHTKTFTRFDIQGPPGAEKPHKDVWVQGYGADTIWGTPDDTYTFTTIVYDTLAAYNTDIAKLQNDPASQSPIRSTDQMNFSNSNFNGILAGVDNLWANIGTVTPTVQSPYTSSPTRIYLMGDVNTFDNRELNLFTGTVVSFDPLVNLNPFMNSKTPVVGGAYGAYYGFLGGAVAPDNTLSGFFRAFYMDKDRNIGLIYTDAALTGLLDSTVGMWKADGNVYTYKLFGSSHINNVTVTPETFAQKFNGSWGQSWENNMSFSPIWDDGHVTGTGINLATASETGISLPVYVNPNTFYLSIGTGAIGGKFEGSTLPTSWSWTFTPRENQLNFISVQDLTITGNNMFAGNIVNTDVDFTNGNTSITGGEIKGLFDPVAHTWQAVRNGTSIDTAVFVNLVNSFTTDAEKNAFMAAMKIPAISVGSVDLAGSRYTTGNSMSVNMAGVNFYAYSTGQAPRIFATNNVTGSYDVSALGGAIPAAVPLSTVTNMVNLTGVTGAMFTPTTSFTTGKWGAQVTGAATMTNPSTSIVFKGGAAGNTSGGTIGTFGGTAAGIVGTAPADQ